MPAVQIEESELLSYRAVNEAVTSMLSHPEARKLVLRARKAANPNVVIPEIDAAEPVNKEVAEIKKLLADEKAERAVAAAQAAENARIAAFTNGWEKQKSTLRTAGWRDEGIAEIEKHAQERGIPDLEVAAAHWEKLHPPAEPVQANGSGSWGFFDEPSGDDKFVEKMIASRGDDESALNGEINAALRDMRSQSGSRR